MINTGPVKFDRRVFLTVLIIISCHTILYYELTSQSSLNLYFIWKQVTFELHNSLIEDTNAQVPTVINI